MTAALRDDDGRPEQGRHDPHAIEGGRHGLEPRRDLVGGAAQLDLDGRRRVLLGALSGRGVTLAGGFLPGLGLVLSSQAQALWQLYVTFGVLVGFSVGAFYMGSALIGTMALVLALTFRRPAGLGTALPEASPAR